MNFEVHEVAGVGADYDALLSLREEVLRKPLGLAMRAEDFAGEEAQRHFGIWVEGDAVACGIAVSLTGSVWRIRQMAVAERFQGRGLGARIVEAIEKEARAAGVKALVLYAREGAVPFYERLGFAGEGEFFLEIGIPHRVMKKVLSESSR